MSAIDRHGASHHFYYILCNENAELPRRSERLSAELPRDIARSSASEPQRTDNWLMRYRPRFRLTPPWPPGLEAIKKALLGPARYRSAAIPVSHTVPPYDDTLPIALAINSFLDGKAEGFSLTAPGLNLQCRVDSEIDSATLTHILKGVGDCEMSSLVTEVATLSASRIRIAGSVGPIQIEHSSWIVRIAKRGKTLKWNPAFRGALELLQARRMEAL